MMTAKTFELAMVAMMFRALETLDARTAAHLLGNAFGAHSFAVDNASAEEWAELPGPKDVLLKRIESDLAFIAKNKTYNAHYPVAEVPRLVADLAAIWHSHARGFVESREPLDRLVAEAKRVGGTIGLSWSKSWSVTIRTEKKRADGNHRFVGCAAALAISRSRDDSSHSEGT